MSGGTGPWPASPFKDVADCKVGRTPARANPDYWSVTTDNVPWVTISDLPAYGIVHDTRETTTVAALEKVFRGQLVPAGTLLMSFKLTIGRVATLGMPAVHNEAIISIHPKPGLDQRFLGYYLSQVDYSQLQDRQIKGNTLNRAKIERIPVPIPPEPVQQRIADLLDHVCDAIRIEREMLDSTTLLKRAVSHRLFTIEEDEYVAGWVSEPVGASHLVSSGGTPSRSVPEYWTGGTIPWVKTTEVNYNIISRTQEHITQLGLDNSAAKVLPAGTVILAMYGQGVTRGKVAILGIDAATNQACAAIQPTGEAVDGRYLYHYLTHQYDELRHLAHGGQQQNLSLEIVRDFPIVYPASRARQAKTVDVLDVLDDKIRMHKERLRLLDALFKALLSGLMNRELDAEGLEMDPPVPGFVDRGTAA